MSKVQFALLAPRDGQVPDHKAQTEAIDALAKAGALAAIKLRVLQQKLKNPLHVYELAAMNIAVLLDLGAGLQAAAKLLNVGHPAFARLDENAKEILGAATAAAKDLTQVIPRAPPARPLVAPQGHPLPEAPATNKE